MTDRLIVAVSPHIHNKESVRKIMWLVSLSLVPAGAAGVIIFGWSAFWVIFWAVITAVVAEGILQLLTKKKVAILDGSAVLTGLLLAYNLPSNVPFWLPIVGSFFAIAIGKQVFGGLGQNIFNPALTGRVFLMACWPKYMTTFVNPGYDAITGATPLAVLRHAKMATQFSYWDLLIGRHGGCIGEVCILALLIGAAFLFVRKYISWHIPITYILTVGLLTFIFGPNGYFSGDWMFHILTGGLILGAFFMATDYVTSPLTYKGQIIFGTGCGVITAVIRLWGGYPEGVSYAILMMNAATPIIDRFTKNRIYGTNRNSSRRAIS
ncbi:MAG: RnfABCDGE type electron transport complex subunit D [Candidatus Omnitrophica bacterium]|nr:RnfABCDGE type electron transport complex subunit D [Candidatus Omnitrophota bacterium]